MKAMPELPTTSASYVAEIGLQAIAAAQIAGTIVGFSRVKVPLMVGTAACGLPQLVHQETGEAWGICASLVLAERIQRFFR